MSVSIVFLLSQLIKLPFYLFNRNDLPVILFIVCCFIVKPLHLHKDCPFVCGVLWGKCLAVRIATSQMLKNLNASLVGWVLARLERNGKESPSIFLWNLSTFWSHMFSLTCSCWAKWLLYYQSAVPHVVFWTLKKIKNHLQSIMLENTLV